MSGPLMRIWPLLGYKLHILRFQRLHVASRPCQDCCKLAFTCESLKPRPGPHLNAELRNGRTDVHVALPAGSTQTLHSGCSWP